MNMYDRHTDWRIIPLEAVIKGEPHLPKAEHWCKLGNHALPGGGHCSRLALGTLRKQEGRLLQSGSFLSKNSCESHTDFTGKQQVRLSDFSQEALSRASDLEDFHCSRKQIHVEENKM